MNSVNIDLAEQFPHLAHAPIVEAVIDIRARASVEWDESSITRQIKEALPDYPEISSHRQVIQEVKFGPGQLPESSNQDLGWMGVRCVSVDQRYIAQFNRDSFVCSRLQPYESWDQFSQEAFRLWHVHADAAKPVVIQRIGVRFINRVELPETGVKTEDYLLVDPKTPRSLDSLSFTSFFHQDSFLLPDSPYGMNVIRTIQHPQSPLQKSAIIVDIDVYAQGSFAPRDDLLRHRLADMRWLKNKAFFGTMTEKALEACK